MAAPVEKVVRSGALRLSIRRYSDGRYGFDYAPPGEARIQVRLRSVDDAEERARELVGVAEAGRVVMMGIDPDEYAEFLRWKAARRTPAMLPALVESLLDTKRRKGRTVATIRDLESTLLPLSKAFNVPIGEMRRDEVERWLEAREVGPRRWNNMLTAIGTLFRFARRDGLLPAELTPVERIDRHRAQPKLDTYSPDELRRILAAVPREWLPVVAFGAFCGLRPEEIAPEPRAGIFKPGLRWENVLWDKSKVDVPAAVSKVRRRRFAVLTDAARAFLEPWRKESGPVAPLKDRGRFVRVYMTSAKVTPRPNALRHSYASYRLALTKDAAALALEMGNSPRMIFNHYLDLKHEEEAEEWFAIRPESTKSTKTSDGSIRAMPMECA